MTYESSAAASSAPAGDDRDLDWVMSRFVEEVPDAAHAILVSADGLLMASSTSIPGERLVPGSVTPPTAAKTRDPEAIRRRLQAHTAGVSRGRRAAQSSTQHTEAGPS